MRGGSHFGMQAQAPFVRSVARSVRRRKLKETPQETTFLPLFVRGARFGASKLASQDGILPTLPSTKAELFKAANIDKENQNCHFKFKTNSEKGTSAHQHLCMERLT